MFPLAWAASDSYPVPPDAAVRGGDSYGFIASAYQSPLSGSPIGPSVLIQTSGSKGGPMTFSFPAPWNFTGPVPAALPVFDFTYPGFTGKTGVNRGAILVWPVGDGNTDSYVFSLSSSANYQGGSANLTFPDLSSLAGFLPAPASGTQVFWLANIIQVQLAGLSQQPWKAPGSIRYREFTGQRAGDW